MARGRPPATELNQKQLLFIREYLKGVTLKAAAKLAGYGENHGERLMQNPLVKKEIERQQEQLRDAMQFDLQAAMQQAAEDRRFAREYKNPMAAHKCTELMSKMAGHLVEKIDLNAKTVDLTAALAPRIHNPELEQLVLSTLLDYNQKRKLIMLPSPTQTENPFYD